uniref:Uncharacterized protein n=2 Tax=Meloidogyne TaxID=189290 RepID=A0A915PAY4_9BILA
MFFKIILAIIFLQLVFDNVNTQEEGDNVEIEPPIVVAQPPIVATTECAHHKNKNGGKDRKGGKGVFKKHKGTKKPKKPKKNNKEVIYPLTIPPLV